MTQEVSSSPSPKMGRSILKTSLAWMAIVLIAFLLASIFSSDRNIKKATFAELEVYVQEGHVESAIITGKTFRGQLKEPFIETNLSGQTRRYEGFEAVLPFIDREMLNQWKASGVRFEFKEERPGLFDYLWSAWPILLIALFWYIIVRRRKSAK